MRWLDDSITDSMDMSLSKPQEIMKDGKCCSPWCCKESDTTQQLNNIGVKKPFPPNFLFLRGVTRLAFPKLSPQHVVECIKIQLTLEKHGGLAVPHSHCQKSGV